ncbi:MAG: LysR family transcriptional regulator [Pigmentiphaga sp.]
MSVDQRQLRYFLEVASSGSINKAAERLHISQSALSRRMALLERATGAALFIRKPTGVELTLDGRRLASQARFLAGHFAQPLAFRTQGTRTAEHGLSVGLVSGSKRVLFSILFEEQRQLHNVKTTVSHRALIQSLFESAADILIERVRRGELDLAVVGNPCDDLILRTSVLWEEKLLLVMPFGCTRQQLGRHRFFLPSQEPRLVSFIMGALQHEQLEPKEITTITPSETTLDLIRSGLGYSILHSSAVPGATSQSPELSIEALPDSCIRMGAVYRNDAARIEDIQRLLETVKEALPVCPSWQTEAARQG